MKWINIKGNKLLVVPKMAAVPETYDDGNILWQIDDQHPTFMQEYIARHNNVRAIIVLGLPDWRNAEVYYLYWYKVADIGDIDGRLSMKQIDDHDFSDTVIVGYNELLCVGKCGRWWHTLFIPNIVPELANPEALRWRKDAKGYLRPQHCPMCGGSFRQPVIKVLGRSRPL